MLLTDFDFAYHPLLTRTTIGTSALSPYKIAAHLTTQLAKVKAISLCGLTSTFIGEALMRE